MHTHAVYGSAHKKNSQAVQTCSTTAKINNRRRTTITLRERAKNWKWKKNELSLRGVILILDYSAIFLLYVLYYVLEIEADNSGDGGGGGGSGGGQPSIWFDLGCFTITIMISLYKWMLWNLMATAGLYYCVGCYMLHCTTIVYN